MAAAMIIAGTTAAKVVKASALVAAVDLARSATAFAADLAVDPPSGVGDLVSTAAQEGLAFSLAVLFVVLLITRRIKVVDPDEVKALEEMKRSVEELQKKTLAMDAMIVDQTRSLDKVAATVESTAKRVEEVHRDLK